MVTTVVIGREDICDRIRHADDNSLCALLEFCEMDDPTEIYVFIPNGLSGGMVINTDGKLPQMAYAEIRFWLKKEFERRGVTLRP